MDKKVILITGASRGIGFALCKKFLDSGYTVIGAVRRSSDCDSLNLLEYFFERSIRFVQCDVTKPSEIEFLKSSIQNKENRLDILVNNAGILPDNKIPGQFSDNSILSTKNDIFRVAFEINAIGALQIIQSFLPLLLESKNGEKKIINISSTAGQLETMESGIPAYSVSKVALNAITKLVASEFEKDNLVCTSFSPGWVKTDMGGANATKSLEELSNEFFNFTNTLSLRESGKFIRNGQIIPW